MKISIGCDEAAYELKEAIKKRLEETGHTYVDNGVEAGQGNSRVRHRHRHGYDGKQGAGNQGSGLSRSVFYRALHSEQ